MNLTICINGIEYPVATTLRVAYKLQAQNNHKSYIDVFKSVGSMSVEQQIDVVYAAFVCADPGHKNVMTAQEFRDYYLDNVSLKTLMQQLRDIMRGISGEDESEASEADTPEQGN